MLNNNNNNNNNNNKSFKALKLDRNKTVSNRVPSEGYEKLKDILRREGRSVGDWLVEKIYDDIKVHGDGNPSYTLDQFTDDSFLATPAFHRPKEAWKSYLIKCSNDEWTEFYNQLEMFHSLERQVINLR